MFTSTASVNSYDKKVRYKMIGAKPLRIMFDKVMDLSDFIMELNI